MGYCLRVGVPSQYVTSQLDQLSLASLRRVAKSSTSFGWHNGSNVTSAGWQVTLCDPIWHESSRSAEAGCKLLYSGWSPDRSLQGRRPGLHPSINTDPGPDGSPGTSPKESRSIQTQTRTLMHGAFSAIAERLVYKLLAELLDRYTYGSYSYVCV